MWHLHGPSHFNVSLWLDALFGVFSVTLCRFMRLLWRYGQSGQLTPYKDLVRHALKYAFEILSSRQLLNWWAIFLLKTKNLKRLKFDSLTPLTWLLAPSATAGIEIQTGSLPLLSVPLLNFYDCKNIRIGLFYNGFLQISFSIYWISGFLNVS